MPTGVTLATCLDELKAEANMSQNVAHGLQNLDALKYLLRRVQYELYIQHDWPMLDIERDITLNAGQRYYNYPADLNFEMINQIVVRNATVWQNMTYGIGPDELNTYNSDDDFRTFPPVHRAHYADTGQLEVWPIPSQTGTLRIYGRRQLLPFIADADVCTLDSTVIVLYAAAEILARVKSEDAPLKLQKAQAHYTALKRRQGAAKRDPFVIGGGPSAHRSKGLRVGIDYIPPGYSGG